MSLAASKGGRHNVERSTDSRYEKLVLEPGIRNLGTGQRVIYQD